MPLELSGGALPGYLICKASRDQRPSETANIGLSRVIEEVEERHTGDTAKVNERVVKKRLQLILGKGKWLDDFIATFQAPPPHRLLAIKCPEIDRTFTSSPSSLSPPRKFAIVGQSALNESAELLPQLRPRRPTHRPHHGIDTPTSDLLVLLKDLVYGRDGGPGPESLFTTNKLMIRRNSSTNRHGMSSQGAIVHRLVLQRM